jgi:hypothetical protein
LVADDNAGVIRVDPINGNQSLVSSGGFFINPNGITIARARAQVPEPTTILLLGSGLIGTIGFRRKLKK